MPTVEEVPATSSNDDATGGVPQVSMEHIMSEMEKNPAMQKHMHDLLESLPVPEKATGPEPGDPITIRGLKGRPELNGCRGFVMKEMEGERWPVWVDLPDKTHERILVKEANLLVHEMNPNLKKREYEPFPPQFTKPPPRGYLVGTTLMKYDKKNSVICFMGHYPSEDLMDSFGPSPDDMGFDVPKMRLAGVKGGWEVRHVTCEWEDVAGECSYADRIRLQQLCGSQAHASCVDPQGTTQGTAIGPLRQLVCAGGATDGSLALVAQGLIGQKVIATEFHTFLKGQPRPGGSGSTDTGVVIFLSGGGMVFCTSSVGLPFTIWSTCQGGKMPGDLYDINQKVGPAESYMGNFGN